MYLPGRNAQGQILEYLNIRSQRILEAHILEINVPSHICNGHTLLVAVINLGFGVKNFEDGDGRINSLIGVST